MEFAANEKKNVEIRVGEDVYLRHAVRTRFISTKDNYIDVIREYVSEIYEKGDILSISEKIISICQNKIVRREDIRIGAWAKFLSRFANRKTGEDTVWGWRSTCSMPLTRLGLPGFFSPASPAGSRRCLGSKECSI